MSDLQNANQGLIGAVFEAVCSSVAGAADAANSMFESEFTWVKTADANAAATLAELVIFSAPRRAALISATFTESDSTGVVAVAANYASIVFNSRNPTTGAALSLGTTNSSPVANGGTGNWAGQWNAQALTCTPFDPTNAVIPAGGSLTVSIAKAGVGVIVPAGTTTFRVRYL
jgi:hypothetical protein